MGGCVDFTQKNGGSGWIKKTLHKNEQKATGHWVATKDNFGRTDGGHNGSERPEGHDGCTIMIGALFYYLLF